MPGCRRCISHWLRSVRSKWLRNPHIARNLGTTPGRHSAWPGHWVCVYAEKERLAALLQQEGVPWVAIRAITAIRSERRIELDRHGDLVLRSKLVGGLWRGMRCGTDIESTFFGYTFRTRLTCSSRGLLASSETTDWAGVTRRTETRHTLQMSHRVEELHVLCLLGKGAVRLVLRRAGDDG